MLAPPSFRNAGSPLLRIDRGFRSEKRFKVLDGVKPRVGALPRYPSNVLSYNLTSGTDGVINEYCEPCEAIVNGTRREVQPLGDREEFSLDGIQHFGRARDSLRYLRRQGTFTQLPDDSLSSPCGDHARAPQ